MTLNMVTPIECPSCGEYDICDQGCACPACFHKPGQRQDEAMAAWKFFAPLMKELNDAEVSWHFCHNNSGYHIGEIETASGVRHGWVEIFRINDEYIVDEFAMTVNATYDSPAEYEGRTVFESTSAHDTAQWVISLI